VGHVPLGHTLEDEFHGLLQKHDDFTSKRVSYLWFESHGQISSIRAVLQNTRLWPSALSGVDPDALWKAVMLIALFKESRPTEESDGTSFQNKIAEAHTKASNHAPEQLPFIEALRDGLSTSKDLFFPYMADIVGNTICADYLDYVRRDPTNVGLDVLRDNRVVRRFYVAEDPADSQPRMALSLVDRHGKPRLDTCTGVVDLVRQRYRFAEIIYYHKTKVAASAMFAKALSMLHTDGMPEIRETARITVKPEDLIKEFNLIKTDIDRKNWFDRLRNDAEPQALLDDDVGDETLHVILQQRAWNAAARAVAGGDAKRFEELLRAVSLLRNIQQRHLYKVCATITPDQFISLSPGTKGKGAQKRLIDEIMALRESSKHRGDIEKAVQQVAGGAPATFILYIPERKSQAKGIETFALEEDGVTTLSNHHAVEKKVQALSEDYGRLWKLILLVNPDIRCNDALLSEAFDTLCDAIWGEDRPRKHYAQTAIDCCWFRYFGLHERQAAAIFAELHETGDAIDYDALDVTRLLASGMEQRQWGLIAYFVSLCRAERVDPLADLRSGDATLTAAISDMTSAQSVEAQRALAHAAVDKYVTEHKQVVGPTNETLTSVRAVSAPSAAVAPKLTSSDQEIYETRLHSAEDLITTAYSEKMAIVAAQKLRSAVELASTVIDEVGDSDQNLTARAHLLHVRAIVAGEHIERFQRNGEISVKQLAAAEERLQQVAPLIDAATAEFDSVADVSRHIAFLRLVTTSGQIDIPAKVVPLLRRMRREDQKIVFANVEKERTAAMTHRQVEQLWLREVDKFSK
jgi:hypothetical protein